MTEGQTSLDEMNKFRYHIVAILLTLFFVAQPQIMVYADIATEVTEEPREKEAEKKQEELRVTRYQEVSHPVMSLVSVRGHLLTTENVVQSPTPFLYKTPLFIHHQSFLL